MHRKGRYKKKVKIYKGQILKFQHHSHVVLFILLSSPSCLSSYPQISDLSQLFLFPSLRSLYSTPQGPDELRPLEFQHQKGCQPGQRACPLRPHGLWQSLPLDPGLPPAFPGPGLKLKIAPGRTQGIEAWQSFPTWSLQNFLTKMKPVQGACTALAFGPDFHKNREGGGFLLSLSLFLSPYQLGVLRSSISDFQVQLLYHFH